MHEIKNGDIIRLASDDIRDWVSIHSSKCSREIVGRSKKHTANNTDYFLFGGLWYEGDALTSKPYGKFGGRLTKGMYPNIEVVGNIANPQDYKKYKEKEKI